MPCMCQPPPPAPPFWNLRGLVFPLFFSFQIRNSLWLRFQVWRLHIYNVDLNIIETFWLKKLIKLTHSQPRSRQTVMIYQKFQFLTDFSILIESFGTGWWCWDKNQDFLIVKTSFLKLSRFSWLLRLTFCQCQDQDSQSRRDWDKSRPLRFLSGLASVPVSSSSHCWDILCLLISQSCSFFSKILSNTI